MHFDQNPIICKTLFGWTGVAASELGISRVVLPKKNKKAVLRELKGSELRVRRSEPNKSTLKGSELGVRGSGHNKSTSTSVLRSAVMLLVKYFSGEGVSFDLPLDMRYYTTFQQAVWKAAAEIPYGETRSYAWIAKRIGNPKAARAVGQAMGANPVPIIVP